MQVQVQMKNWNKVEHLLRKLPINLQKEIMSKGNSFLQDVRKSAKIRAPRFSGYLASSIL